MGIGGIGQRIIVKLANKLGAEQTAKLLDIRPSLLMRFIEGTTPVPDQILLTAVDLVLEEFPEPKPHTKLEDEKPEKPLN